jgi:hypothetical protein
MTVKALDTGMTRNLVDRLSKLAESVKKLSSENFEKVSPALVLLDRKLESVNYIYGGMSMVNSVDSYKIDGMIRHLKMSNREYLYIEQAQIVPPGGDGPSTYHVPAGFSGFNSFIFPWGINGVRPGMNKTDALEFSNWYTKNDRTIRFDFRNFLKQDVNRINDDFVNFVGILFWR